MLLLFYTTQESARVRDIACELRLWEIKTWVLYIQDIHIRNQDPDQMIVIKAKNFREPHSTESASWVFCHISGRNREEDLVMMLTETSSESMILDEEEIAQSFPCKPLPESAPASDAAALGQLWRHLGYHVQQWQMARVVLSVASAEWHAWSDPLHKPNLSISKSLYKFSSSTWKPAFQTLMNTDCWKGKEDCNR